MKILLLVNPIINGGILAHSARPCGNGAEALALIAVLFHMLRALEIFLRDGHVR
ncbi:hypothetical protein [Nioella aestuarii]|uniref:hypothetical protein n=1 Tax=Nioella aestuarii TaxID=1662864 RepID=UPI003D7FCD27